jgi:hypothetical protein
MTSAADKRHLSRVAALGCIICRNGNLGDTPAEIHHIREGYGRGQRAPHTETLPLCPIHSRATSVSTRNRRNSAVATAPSGSCWNRYGPS